MPFNAKKFMKEKFQHRTQDIPVPDMALFFEDGEAPVWKVRGITGQELGKSNEAVDKYKSMAALVEGLTAESGKDKADAIMGMLGLGSDVPADVAKRIEMLIYGSVEPKCTQDLAVKICETYPIEFYQLTNAILRLTGQGQMVGKQKPSGEIAASEQASACAMPEDDSSTR